MKRSRVWISVAATLLEGTRLTLEVQMTGFVRWAESANKDRTPLRLLRTTSDDVNYWDEHVQPEVARMRGRADRYWNWPFLLWWVNRVGRSLWQQPLVLTLSADLGGSRGVPVGFVAVMQKYPFPRRKRDDSVFVWFMTAAPKELLPQLLNCPEDRVPIGVMRFCLDAAVVLSYDRRLDGRTWLHASKKGGDVLMQWYARQAMTNLEMSVKLPFGSRMFGNDGRYFEYDEEGAAAAVARLDKYR